MRLCKKEDITDCIYPEDLSMEAVGLINSLLVKSNDELNDINIYSISNDNKRNILVAFIELKRKNYIAYDNRDETYYIYKAPQQ